MANQFVNYSLDDFNNDQTDSEDQDSFWNSAELQRNQNLNHSRAPNINYHLSFHPTFLYWRPNKKLQSLQDRFNEKILMQFPSVPCSFCSILMFPTNAKWIQKDDNRTYPLTLIFPDEEPVEHINDPSKIAVCSSCKDLRLRRSPPNIVAPYVFKSISWNLFMPLFLTKPRRQSEDIEFFEILQQIRFNQLTSESREKLKAKVVTPSNNNKSPLETTHIMGYRHMADLINETTIAYLPTDEPDDLSFTSFAQDKLDNRIWDVKKCNKHFRKYTNLPDTIYIKKGA
jgi:hypothetical protein